MPAFRLKFATFALSAVVLATSFTPSSAFTTIPVPVRAERATDVEQVQYRRYREGDWNGRRGYYRRGDAYYFNGYRGYRYRRSGYREYNGYWYPLAAFGAGAIIGGAIANPPVRYAPTVRYGGGHVSWCANRYRSYRAYDNTYQPYDGPRRQCYSPYS